MNSPNITLSQEERPLLIINDNLINGSTRFQKYGFLLFKQYQKELIELKFSYPTFNFYDDWVPHNFGPYSKNLQEDLNLCVENKIIIKVQRDRTQQYSLTLKGRVRWRKLFTNSYDEMRKINEKIINLQTFSLYGLLKSIYDAYPQYAVNSKIKDKLN